MTEEKTVEKYSLYMNKFRVALGILFIAIAVFVFLIVKTIPEIKKISDIQTQQTNQSRSLADAERRLSDLKNSVAKEEKEVSTIAKAFFRPVNFGSDTEAVISEEFNEILQLMRENKIKTRSIKYDPDPQDDNFVKNVPDKYYVCKISMEMVANYSQFENFIRDLFKHEHFLEISTVEITPYPKNKRILLISLQIKLYAQREGASES